MPNKELTLILTIMNCILNIFHQFVSSSGSFLIFVIGSLRASSNTLLNTSLEHDSILLRAKSHAPSKRPSWTVGVGRVCCRSGGWVSCSCGWGSCGLLCCCRCCWWCCGGGEHEEI